MPPKFLINLWINRHASPPLLLFMKIISNNTNVCATWASLRILFVVAGYFKRIKSAVKLEKGKFRGTRNQTRIAFELRNL